MDTIAMDLLAMKSSRRKQSKPIRVSYNDDSEMGVSVPPPIPDDIVNGDSPELSDTEHEKENKFGESGRDSYREKSELRDTTSPINLATRETAFPTAYHRLASEFSMKNVFSVPNGHNNNVIDSENSIDKNGNDVVDGEFGEKTDGDDKPKDRSGIFHPDAYCELCDKEFCNKYFLKTHKANKHGIYENNTSPFAPSVNPLPPSLVLPQDYSSLPFKLNMDFPLPPFKPTSNSAKPPTPQLTPTLPASSPHRQSPPMAQSLLQTPIKPAPSPIPSKPKSTSDSASSSTAGSENGEKKATGQDMEDFCEICQKHFCNKYYLKKHKNDVHGIAPPDTPMSGKRGGRPPNSELKLPPTPSSADNPLIPHSLASMPGLPNMPGVMVLNPFLPPMLIPGGLMNQHGPLPPRPPHLPLSSPLPYSSSGLPITTVSDSKTLSSSSSSTLATSSSPSGSNISPDALRNIGIPVPDGASPNDVLRRMGLMSPDGQVSSEALRSIGLLGTEAFCDICRKEFCNRYFLKIHKANKHGVYMDEPILPPSMSGAMNMSLPNKNTDHPTAHTSDHSRSDKDKMKEAYDILKPSPSPKTAATPSSQSSEYMTQCNLCNLDFASKYAYRIHRIQAHGMISEPFNEAELAEEAFRLHNGDLPKHVSNKIAEEISAMERNTEAQGFSTMFGSMVAAKLADRVTCDICNKELCNKYFLKVHKMKVHGVDAAAVEKSPKPGTTMHQSDRSLSKHDFSPSRPDFSSFVRSFNLKPDNKEYSLSRPNSTTSLDNQMPAERPSNEELVKMGMDPEAYCEICKKEFCSKYFLRTHKQNIHGIPTKSEGNEKGVSLPSLASMGSMAPHLALSNPPALTMAPHLALSTPLLPSTFMSGMSPFGQIKPMNLSNSLGSSSGRRSIGGMSSSSRDGKWKEPQNSARVTCDLCNKELCNKYFLRTHKIKKHGILPEDLSPCTSQNMSPNTSDIETSSNSSIPTDLSHDKTMQSPKLNIENSKLFCKMDEPNIFSEALNLKVKQESLNNNYEAETCHLCSRKFKSSKWLRQHILKDHAGLTALSPTMEKAFNIGSRYAPLELRTCSVCSIVFPSEMSMQLHMIQEHNAQVTIKTEEQSSPVPSEENKGQFSGTSKKFGPRFSFSVKQKSYSCSVCNHKSKWLSNILSHERSIHGIEHNLKKLQCKICRKGFRRERVYQEHMMKVHGDYSMSESRLAKQYRCTTCDKSFPTPLECHLHIRKDHIRGHSFRVNNHRSERHFCNQCSFSTRFRKQLQRHVLRCHNLPDRLNKTNAVNVHAEAVNGCGDYEMQTFEIKQCNDDGVFVTSIVEMPVLKKLKDSTSVSFFVTPVDAQ